MSLTGERLRRLLHSNSLNRKQKRRTNRQSSEKTAGDGDREDDDDDEEEEKEEFGTTRETKCVENIANEGLYVSRYGIANRLQSDHEKRNIKSCEHHAPNAENITSTAPPKAIIYTASVIDELAFKKLDRQDLPPGVKPPRSTSLNVYVFDKELTERIKGRQSAGSCRRTSKRAQDVVVPRRIRSDKEYAFNGGAGETAFDSAPEIPPKPKNLPRSPLSVNSSEPKGNKQAPPVGTASIAELQGRTPPRSQEPPLPLLPRNNRPRPPIALPVILPNATETVEPGTPNQSENGGNAAMIIDGKCSKGDEDENPYEPVETQDSLQTEEVSRWQPAMKPDNDIADITSLEDMEESDSTFDYRSYGLSPRSNCSHLNEKSWKSIGGCSSDWTPRSHESRMDDESSNSTCLPTTNGRMDSDSTILFQSEIALPKVLKIHSDYTTGSESGETDTYEAIDVALKGHADGGRQAAPFDSREYDTVADTEVCDSDWLFIRRDDIVIVETGDVHRNDEGRAGNEEPQMNSSTSDTDPASSSTVDLDRFLNTSLSYDKDGNAVYIPSDKLKVYGDPSGEPWFYPLELSSREATLFLRSEHKEGCFLVYKPLSGSSTASYNLSISRGNGDVLHYHILEGPQSGFIVEGHERSFMNISDLVEYFKRNKSSLATRLRRPLKEARLPITAGYHYDLKYELDRDRLSLTGSIIGKGYFGVVCSGLYKSIPVAVKVLQGTEISLEDEDDFIEEARVLMMLSDDHIVRIIGVSSSSRPFFLVTEFIQHGNLKEYLRSGRIPTDKPDIYFDICIQMLAALSYLENIRYVLHRDIAARNFLVADLKCIKLADFGRARHVTDDSYQAPRTEKISIKWAAPEVLLEFRYSTKADIWAAGIAMWEAYSLGQRPYESLSAEQTAVYVTEGGRLARPTLCPEEVYSCVRKCWRRTAASRPSASVLQQMILENRRATIYRRNLKKLDEASRAISTSLPRPKSKAPLTPTLKKKNIYNNSDAGKQRLSTIRDVFMTSSFRESHSMKKSDSQERLPTSSSSDNISSLSSAPDTTTTQKIRNSFRKLIITKKMRTNSKSKADYITSQEKPTGRRGAAEL